MYAVVDDVEVDFGPIAPADHARVEALIERAEAFLLAEVRDLPARIVDGRTSNVLVAQVVAELVADRLRNPHGLRSFAHTEGPFTTSGTYADTGGASGLSARHLRLLGGETVSGAFTITPGRRP